MCSAAASVAASEGGRAGAVAAVFLLALTIHICNVDKCLFFPPFLFYLLSFCMLSIEIHWWKYFFTYSSGKFYERKIKFGS